MTVAASLLLRNQIAGLTGFAERDLRALWRQVASADEASVALYDVLPSLIETYGQAAAVVAADWYDDTRDRAGAKGRFRAFPALVPESGAPSLIGWAASQATSLETMLPLVMGGVQKRIANVSRFTVADSAIADSGSEGWVRVGFGECDWCQQYIDGEVRTVAGYDFDAHDWCQCDAEPVFW